MYMHIGLLMCIYIEVQYDVCTSDHLVQEDSRGAHREGRVPTAQGKWQKKKFCQYTGKTGGKHHSFGSANYVPTRA